MSRIGMRNIEYLVCVASCGSVTGAALDLGVSPSSVSSGIAELEKTLNLQLLIRHHARGVSLTAAGERIVIRARSLLEDANQILQDAAELGQGVSGEIVVAVFSVLAPYLVPGLSVLLKASHPELSVRFTELDLTELADQVAAGRCELGIGYGFDPSPTLSYELIQEIPPHLCVPAGHRLAKKSSVCLGDIEDENFILLDLPHSRDYFARILDEAGVRPRISFQARSADLARALVARNMGVSLLNMRPASDRSVEGLAYRELTIAEPVEPARIVASWTRDARLTRRAEAVLATLRNLVVEKNSTSLKESHVRAS